jgi:Phosphotransferase enzyme family
VEPRAIEVVHDRPWSTVLRVATAEGDLFLKRCAPVQAFEVPLTVALATRWPDRVPEVVAADGDRAWLLMRDAGTRLRELDTVEPLLLALRLYGELQLREIAHVGDFLAMGVPDIRVPLLAAAFEPFLERDHGLGPDEVERLRRLAPRYRELCEELDAFGLPASIQHDDLHDANVFIRDGRVAIFDWGDSSVAHPLFSWLKPLWVAQRRSLDPEPFLRAYLSAWQAFEPDAQLRTAVTVAVPVSSFAYAFQYQRQLDAMGPGVRPRYEPYMAEQLRTLLVRLDSLA